MGQFWIHVIRVAIDAFQIAAVGNGNAQVIELAVVFIDEFEVVQDMIFL